MGAEHVGSTQRSVPSKARAAVILGNDAVVASGACTSDQLASACRAAGFDVVVPPTWGDELVAAHYLEQIGRCGERLAAACACPRVRSLVAQVPPERVLACVAMAAPPVAAARYLRALHGNELLITYVGDCPGGSDPSIDACFSPTGFLASLQRQGISIDAQSAVEVRRDTTTWQRHFSTPGGLPALRFLARAPVDRVVREADLTTISGTAVNGRAKVVIDLATAAGCVCSAHRDQIEEREPPRNALPVISAIPGLDLSAQPSSRPRRHAARARRSTTEVPARPEVESTRSVVVGPAVVVPKVAGRSVAEPTVAAVAATAPPTRLREPMPVPAQSTTRSTPSERRPSRARPIVLLVLPIAILGAVTALGVAAYSTGSSAREASAQVPAGSMQAADSVIPGASSLGALATPALADSDSTRDTVSAADSTSGRAVVAPESIVRADSLAKQPPRRPRRPPAEVIPGWMPQGQNAWRPDSNLGRKRDSTASKRRPDSIPPAPRPDTIPPA